MRPDELTRARVSDPLAAKGPQVRRLCRLNVPRRPGIAFLSPLRLPGPDSGFDERGRPAAEAAETARTAWAVRANVSLGAADLTDAAEGVWPTERDVRSLETSLWVARTLSERGVALAVAGTSGRQVPFSIPSSCGRVATR